MRATTAHRLALLGLALGVAFDLLFYRRPLGLNALAWVCLAAMALAVAARWAGTQPIRRNLWLLGPLLVAAAMIAVRDNEMLTLLNLATVLGLLGVVSGSFAAVRVEALGLVGYPLLLAWVGLESLLRPVMFLSHVGDGWAARHGGRRFWPVLRGLVLAAPIVFVFALLLSSADLVFSRYLARLVQLDFLPDLADAIEQAGLVLAVGWLATGALAVALTRQRSRQAPGGAEGSDQPSAASDGLTAIVPAPPPSIPWPRLLGAGEALTVLACVDVLFLAFVWIQVTYLFGGEANIGAENLTYAEYARRGFFELVAVAVLSLGLILCLQALVRRETARQRRAFDGLATGVVLLVGVMLLSAFLRMSLYEAAYGFTELRIITQVFMVWLGLLLAWLLVVLWRQPERFAIGALVCGLGFVATLDAIDPDALIVRRNVARHRVTGKIDSEYLTRLSADAVPELVAALDALPQADAERVCASLERGVESMEPPARWPAWPSFHLARARAMAALQSLGSDPQRRCGRSARSG